EFRMATNTNAELGWTQGTTVELITKSGTNKFHGSAFEYVKNKVFNTRGFIPPKVPVNNLNEYGGTFGGPIKKNKLFIIGSFDKFDNRTAGSGLVKNVLTTAMRNGDFSEVLGAQIGTDALGRPIYKGEIYDPATSRTLPDGSVVRDPFMYNGQLNVIDPARISNVSKTFTSWMPMPTRPGVIA